LTKNAVGKKMVMMQGDTPLLAANILFPLTGTGFDLDFENQGAEKAKGKKVEQGLKRLVR
jgi:hypothetical protein